MRIPESDRCGGESWFFTICEAVACCFSSNPSFLLHIVETMRIAQEWGWETHVRSCRSDTLLGSQPTEHLQPRTEAMMETNPPKLGSPYFWPTTESLLVKNLAPECQWPSACAHLPGGECTCLFPLREKPRSPLHPPSGFEPEPEMGDWQLGLGTVRGGPRVSSPVPKSKRSLTGFAGPGEAQRGNASEGLGGWALL